MHLMHCYNAVCELTQDLHNRDVAKCGAKYILCWLNLELSNLRVILCGTVRKQSLSEFMSAPCKKY